MQYLQIYAQPEAGKCARCGHVARVRFCRVGIDTGRFCEPCIAKAEEFSVMLRAAGEVVRTAREARRHCETCRCE